MNSPSSGRRRQILPARVREWMAQHKAVTAVGTTAVVAGLLGLGALSDGSPEAVAAVVPVTASPTSAATPTSEYVAPTRTPAPTTAVAPTTAAPPTTAPTTPAPTMAPATAPTTVSAVRVTGVVDGDTVDLSTGQRVRIIGIDTPEVGQCGSESASARLRQLVLGKVVDTPAGASDDVDHYGRILRYVDVAGVDSGLVLLNEGLAIARYDSRDGYGGHARESSYVTADALSNNVGCPQPAPKAPAASGGGGGTGAGGGGGSAYYANCTEARNAGVTPIYEGEPGYSTKLDRDRDGIACE